MAPAETVEELRAVADDVVCLETPAFFMAIGEWYADFRQTTDEEVTRLLAERAAVPAGARSTLPRGRSPARCKSPRTLHSYRAPSPCRDPDRRGDLRAQQRQQPAQPRNVAVACALNQGGLATLLFDLLSPAETVDRANVFDIGLLSERLAQATAWLPQQPKAADLAIGYSAQAPAPPRCWPRRDCCAAPIGTAGRGLVSHIG